VTVTKDYSAKESVGLSVSGIIPTINTQNKHVESLWISCLDTGSTPVSSTKEKKEAVSKVWGSLFLFVSLMEN